MYQGQCQQLRGELRVSRLVRDLGVGALPAVPKAVAVAVHLQDVDVVDEAVRAEHLGTSGTTFVLSEVPVGWKPPGRPGSLPTKPKPRWNLHLRGDEDWLRRHR